MTTRLEIGQRIRLCREQHKLSMRACAIKARMPWSNLGKIERGITYPAIPTLLRLQRLLRFDLHWVLTGDTFE